MFGIKVPCTKCGKKIALFCKKMGLSSSNEMQAEDFSIIRKENEIYKNISHIDRTFWQFAK